MRRPTVRYLIASQVCLYLGLLVCVLLRPLGLTHNSGVSYYGIFANTIIPYAVALLGAATFGLLAARHLEQEEYSLIRLGIWAIALLLVGVATTPYSLSVGFDYIHTTFGTLLFIVQLALTGWLTFWKVRNPAAICLWLFELAAGIVSGLYVAPPDGYLLESQLAFQFFFAVLLVYCLQRLLPDLPHGPMQPITPVDGGAILDRGARSVRRR